MFMFSYNNDLLPDAFRNFFFNQLIELTKTVDLVEILNEHFVTIGKKLAHAFGKNERLPTFESKTDAQFSLHCVSEEYVKYELRKLKTNKAIGLDKISAKLLKDASEVIAPSIQKLINMSITQCCFPDLWKSAKITAIFKSGNPQDCDNYRPISILPTLSKILERAVKSQLYNYLEENSLLYSQQSGFRSRRSTSTALLQMTDTLLNNMDKRQVTGVVYLDLKKAFDTVNRSLLLRKLGAYGVDDRCVKWFRSYLTHRTQCTTIGEVSSTKRSVPVGVPQGTVLGPLLFLIYVNDITECLKNTQASLFADDTMVYCSGSTRNELQENLNGDLSRIKKWLNDHRLTINAEKSQFMVIGSSQRIKAFESMILRIDEDELSTKMRR